MAKQQEIKEELKGINSKLLLIQGELSAIKRTNVNPHFKKSYADINQILSDIKPILTSHGVIISQPILEGSVWTVLTDVGSGESVNSSIPITTGLKPQEVGSAITYFRRYTLASLLALETEDDDDANKTIPKAQTPQPIKPVETPYKAVAKPSLVMYNDEAKTELSESFQKAVDALKTKMVTIEQIKNKYSLSPEVEKILTNI
jgi:ERF superfamily